MPGDVTSELSRLKAGSLDGWAKVIPKVYGELRRLAASHLRRESENHTSRSSDQLPWITILPPPSSVASSELSAAPSLLS